MIRINTLDRCGETLTIELMGCRLLRQWTKSNRS